MPKTVLLDEWHLTFRIHAALSDVEVRAVCRVLKGKGITAAVLRTMLAEIKKHCALKSSRPAPTR